MRIITGSARGARLTTLDSDATRPTAEKVKEAIFSMIQFDIEGRRVLDLFGGSGQLALEALSRGASKATIIDESRDAVNVIIDNAKHAKLYDRCRIAAASYDTYLRGFSDTDRFNIVFLDPPYASDMMHGALKLISERKICAPGALIVCETDTVPSKKKRLERRDSELLAGAVLHDVFSDDAELQGRFTVIKSNVHGRTRITLLSPDEGTAEASI